MVATNNSILPMQKGDNYILVSNGSRLRMAKIEEILKQPSSLTTVVATPHPA